MVFDPSAEAVVDEEIQPNHRGRVRYKGSYWPARCPQGITLEEGATCSVVNIEGITLIVLPTRY